MIHEITLFGCDCDGHGCEEFWQDSDTGSIARPYADEIKTEATNDDWHFTEDGKAYCPECHFMIGGDVIILNNGLTNWIKP